MGAASSGLQAGQKAGKSAGQKQGRRAGENSDPEGNKYKEGLKAGAKGAVGGAAEGAARGAAEGAARGAVSGVKDGAQVGAKIGASIPYVGPVTGAIGGVVGGAVGGASGAAIGGTAGAASGAATGAASGAQEGVQETARNSDKGRIRKGIGSLWDNIKGAFKGNVKDIFLLKAKLIIYAIIAVLVFFALIIEGDAEETSSTATRVNSAAFAESTTKSAKLYNETGSLLLATDDELEKIKQAYFDEIEDSRPNYYESFNIICKGKGSNTVANRVTHISTTDENSEEKEANKVDATVSIVKGAALPSDERTIYEHILRTEKYNFNNVVWRSFVKSGSGLKSSNISFTVDSSSKLKYPSDHGGATNADSLDLEFFVNKIRPYLQSWYVPFDLMIGTIDAQDESNLNANFAYEILTSAYHEIVADRYKLEKLDRKTNYLIYDKKTTTTTTTRKCNDYVSTSTSVSIAKRYSVY